jgi:hypothetical protein
MKVFREVLVTATAVSILLVGSGAIIAQDKAAAAHEGEDRIAPSRIFYEKSGGHEELRRWLQENGRLLDRGDVCTLNVSWMNEETKGNSSAVHNVASFLVVPEDEEVTRLIRDTESGLDVRVGVQYHPIKSGLSEIRIALAFEGAPDDIFYEISRGEAKAIRQRKWKFLEAAKDIRIASLRYTFYLTCENGRTSILNKVR